MAVDLAQQERQPEPLRQAGNFLVEDGPQLAPDGHPHRVVRRQASHVALYELQPRLGAMVLEVLEPAGQQVVEGADAVSPLEQQVDHVAADESGPARDDRNLAHELLH